MANGFLLTVEGLGGSGKSTLCKRIGEWFEQSLVPFVATFEPGGTPAANFLRKLCREGIEGAEPLHPMCEALLFNAARAQHTEAVIKPALAAGKVVLCDRYMLSTYGYQGIARQLGVYPLAQIHHHAIGVYPDLTILLDADPAKCFSRLHPDELASDQFDNLALSTQERVQEHWIWESEQHPDKFLVIDADQDMDQMFAQVLPVLMKIQNSLMVRPAPEPLPRHSHIGVDDIPKQVVDLTAFVNDEPTTIAVHADGKVIIKDKVDFTQIVPGRVENTGIKDT